MKKNASRDNGESLLQVAYTNWVRVALPHVLSFHVYNENSVNAIQGKIKKDRGVLAGVHDNHLFWEHRNYASLELKSPLKRPSENKYSDKQEAFAERLDKIGFRHACCQNGEQIEAYIRSLGLVPKFPFPKSLASTGRLMLQQEVMDELYRRD